MGVSLGPNYQTGAVPVKILIVSSEAVPFAKTGGLADVAGALPVALAQLGHDVRVVMPKYSSIDAVKFNLLPILGDIKVRLSTQEHMARVFRTMIPDTSVPIYFVDNPEFFDRDALYGLGAIDYPDNAVRFAFFSKAVVWMLKGLDWIPDVMQCNDWQTALIPVYLRTHHEMYSDYALSSIKMLYTIHNLAYQGLFPEAEAPKIDIGQNLFHPSAMEFYGKLNLMKGGILFSDEISTVSRRYAEEIQTKEYGCGLEGVLSYRKNYLSGILNGIDYRIWNPETDHLLPDNYSVKRLGGKAECKSALQRECLLGQSADIPLIGIISRLDVQKGFDLIAEIIDDLMAQEVQIVLLGTGTQEYHDLFGRLAKKYEGRLSANLRFDNGLAHRIEAGSDIFLMPSRYEPCGLNQLYSLKYGTIPVVRATGGLADSITDAAEESIASGEATGFVFEEYTSKALRSALDRALDTYRDTAKWKQLIRNAMEKDFSWGASARAYEKLFARMLGRS